MKALLITTGYLPYTFSECLCNAKLVYALQENGWEVDVISRVSDGETYCSDWTEPWLCLRQNVHEVDYAMGTRVSRYWDMLCSAIGMGYPLAGIRWAHRAYKKAVALHKENHYDVIFTRSPSDVSHIVGLKLKKRFGIQWIANWNDPVDMIWPSEVPPYIRSPYKGFKKYMYKSYFNSCLGNADVNTFPAQTLLDHFSEFFPILQSNNAKVIPHIGCSHTIYSSHPYKKGKQFRLVHAGNLVNKRNPELFFKALRELIDESKIQIYFDVMGVMSDYMFQLVKKYDLQDYVRFIGSYSYIEALKKMSEYDVLVLLEAKMRNGIFFASKITDYAQVERPILAISPVKGFAKSAISQYGGGYVVNNEDVHDIKRGLLELYSAWEKGELQNKYSAQELFNQFEPCQVVNIYNTIVKGDE